MHVRPFESLELDPTQARRLKLIENASSATSAFGRRSARRRSGARFSADRSESARRFSVSVPRQDRRHDVHLHPLPSPGLLCAPFEQFRSSATAIQKPHGTRPRSAHRRHRPGSRSTSGAEQLRAHLESGFTQLAFPHRSGGRHSANMPRFRHVVLSRRGPVRPFLSYRCHQPRADAWPPTSKATTSPLNSLGIWSRFSQSAKNEN